MKQSGHLLDANTISPLFLLIQRLSEFIPVALSWSGVHLKSHMVTELHFLAIGVSTTLC